MKIGIDARICEDGSIYAQFVQELCEKLASDGEHDITIYRHNNLPLKRGNFFDERKAKKIFTTAQYDCMIFFDAQVPAGYKGKYIMILESLKEVFFPKKKWLQRTLYTDKLKKSISHAEKVIMLDSNSCLELNEELNIPEEKIEKIPAFFPTYNLPKPAPVSRDIKAKHNIAGNYLIYDGGNELHNNFDRIIKALHNIQKKGEKLSLLVLCEDTTRDLDIRGKVLEYNLTPQVFFLGAIRPGEEYFYYTQSSGVIYSSIYESFPFQFQKALAYNCPIFANDIFAHEHVMGKNLFRLDPLSLHAMSEEIIAGVASKNTPEYSQVQADFSPEKSLTALKKILETLD